MNKEIEKISKKLHELKMALYLGAYDRAENEESENEDPLITAAELIEQALVIVDKEFKHSNTFLLLKANGEITRVTLPLGDAESFNGAVHELISCQYYEVVSIHQDFLFIVDELGKVSVPVKTVNKKASLFYSGTNFGDPLVGDVLIGKYGYVNGEPDAVGLDDDELKYFEGIINSIK